MTDRTSNEQVYNKHYSRTTPVRLGDLATLQMALATADDFMLWLTAVGGMTLPSGAASVKKGLEEGRELALHLCHLAESSPETPSDPTSTDSADTYTLDFALRIARLWRAGKLIGADEDAVRNALLAEVERLHASETKEEPSLTLNGYQLKEALEFVAPDNDADQLETDVTIQWGEGHCGPGHYACLTEYPDEGSILLAGDPPESPVKSGEKP